MQPVSQVYVREGAALERFLNRLRPCALRLHFADGETITYENVYDFEVRTSRNIEIVIARRRVPLSGELRQCAEIPLAKIEQPAAGVFELHDSMGRLFVIVQRQRSRSKRRPVRRRRFRSRWRAVPTKLPW